LPRDIGDFCHFHELQRAREFMATGARRWDLKPKICRYDQQLKVRQGQSQSDWLGNYSVVPITNSCSINKACCSWWDFTLCLHIAGNQRGKISSSLAYLVFGTRWWLITSYGTCYYLNYYGFS
jgi:hypothetical protein